VLGGKKHKKLIFGRQTNEVRKVLHSFLNNNSEINVYRKIVVLCICTLLDTSQGHITVDT